MYRRLLLTICLLGISGCAVNLGEWAVEPNYVDLTKSEDYSGEAALKANVDLKVGQMDIEPGDPGQLYNVRFHYNDNVFRPLVDLSRNGEEASLALGLDGSGKSMSGLGENILSLKLNPLVPLNLEASSGVGESDINLSGMKVSALTLQSGVGRTRIMMEEPNPMQCGEIEVISGVGELQIIGLGNFSFEEFRLRGGVGKTTLDFSGAWNSVGDVEIEVGVGGIEILIPREVGAEVRVSKGYFSDLEMPAGFEKEGDTYLSENRASAKTTVKFRIRSGVGRVDIRWI